jgi:hypothetical protein
MRASGHITSIALTFSRLASIPWCETKKPSSFLAKTPNTHLFGFNIVRVEHNLVETSVVDAHPKFLAGHGDDNRVGQPPWVVDLPNESGVKQLLDNFTDEVLPLNRLLSGLLLHWPGIGVDLQMVLNHLPRDPGHLLWLLGKHVNIIPEEGHEHEFLFLTQIPRDAGGLGGIHADLDDLHRDVRGLHARYRR